ALYDQLLRELAAKASGVPIGSNSTPAEPLNNPNARNRNGFARVPQFTAIQPRVSALGRSLENQNPNGARSSEYVQVLDKYLSRLAALNRPMDALRVYRGE